MSDDIQKRFPVVQLLKSWEYKNKSNATVGEPGVVQLLKSWEYKNRIAVVKTLMLLYSYLNLESTKTEVENFERRG